MVNRAYLKQHLKRKSYVGQPYYRSDRNARIYTTMKAAVKAARRQNKPYTIFQLGGRGAPPMYVIKTKGNKFYSK